MRRQADSLRISLVGDLMLRCSLIKYTYLVPIRIIAVIFFCQGKYKYVRLAFSYTKLLSVKLNNLKLSDKIFYLSQNYNMTQTTKLLIFIVYHIILIYFVEQFTYVFFFSNFLIDIKWIN